MTAKITSEDCKRAIEAAWPADFPPLAADFKRIAKSGKKGSPIERLFYHRSLPLKAVVVEENGAITATTISGVGPWDVCDAETEADEAMSAIVESHAGFDFLSSHDLFKPSDFVFFVSDEQDENMEDFPTWYVLTPVSYWRKSGCAYDGELDHYIKRHLPEDGGEASEGTFCSDLSPEAVRADLLKRGFVQDAEFDAFMGGERG